MLPVALLGNTGGCDRTSVTLLDLGLFMRRVMIVSSYVAHGTVGLQATLPALPAAKFEVIAVPTVVLSNHPGFEACSGAAIAPEIIMEMVEALEANGWLKCIDAVFSGYLPSAAHVNVMAQVAQRVKLLNPAALYVVDPVLGDDPGGLYLSRDTAEAVRDRLVPLADLVTPNRFELSWLTEMPVTDLATGVAVARTLKLPRLAATSVPAGEDLLANILVTPSRVLHQTVPREVHAPHGTGDYFAGLLTAALLLGNSDDAALLTATKATAKAIADSAGQMHLNFAGPPSHI